MAEHQGPAGRRDGLVVAGLLAVCATAAAVAGEVQIPQSLREGWGFADDVRELGESLGGGYELSERDLDCDGRPEVVLEALARRGATGNRGFLLFDHGSPGYRYLGESGAIWAVVDYGDSGGCYLASYGKTGAGALTLRLTSTRGGGFEPLGEVELAIGGAGSDDDNSLLSALRAGGLDEAALRRLAAVSELRPVALPETFPALHWSERSTVEEVVEEVEGQGAEVFERLRPATAEPAGASPWWGRVSPRAARQWAAAVEERIVRREPGDETAGGLEIVASRIEQAVRLHLPLGRPPVGLALGRFDAERSDPSGGPARAVQLSWAAVFAINRFSDPETVAWLRVGTAGEGESRRLFRLERLTNLDHDREPEAVIEEASGAGRALWLLDVSRPGEVDARRLHAGAREGPRGG